LVLFGDLALSFAIQSSPLSVVGLRRFPRQTLSLQSFIIFSESVLRFFVFRCGLPFTGALKSHSSLSLRKVWFIAHRSPPISVTNEMTIAQQQCVARTTAD
jgi:hypothetical protein